MAFCLLPVLVWCACCVVCSLTRLLLSIAGRKQSPTLGVVTVATWCTFADRCCLCVNMHRFPWWPAVVVPPPRDDQHPAGQQAATNAAQQAGSHGSRVLVFVRFLGTHDTAWLAPNKVSAWAVQLGERSSKTKAAAFVSGLKEARAYAATGKQGACVSMRQHCLRLMLIGTHGLHRFVSPATAHSLLIVACTSAHECRICRSSVESLSFVRLLDECSSSGTF